ncbi:MAG: ABC transporter ATP-binding protein [Burkholderiales bacterium]|nr:ABC transporter ATP-binding protein [Burkholderiales bacterium]MCE7876132.1 ABC transporter ATP-binding protein [Betaproteobacteria bacterium PRO3]
MSSRQDAERPILEIQRVSKRFGEFTAVDDVSISVRRGEFLTFLGPSGCGKTTLLRIIAGFETPTRGDVRIGGLSMARVRPYRRPVGIVFQNLALFPHLSVGENVAFGLAARRVANAQRRRQVADALGLVELAGLERRRIHELSGGQKQRVALARALVLQPDVLLLDEPLGALDLKLRRQLQYELKEIQRRVGTTFLFVTHDQEEALTMSDRIAVFHRGRIEQIDEPEAVYRRPSSAFVARFVGDTNLLEGKVRTVGSEWLEIELGSLVGKVRLPAATQVEAGSRVMLSVRPEHVRLGDEALSAGAGSSATVEGRAYVGATTRYVLRAAGMSIVAQVSSADAGGRTYRIGETVPLSLGLDHAALVPDRESVAAAPVAPMPGRSAQGDARTEPDASPRAT